MRRGDLVREIDHWAESGIISADQADRIRADLAAETPHRSLVAEGLAYVGGSLVAVAVTLISGRYWTDLHTAGRLALVGGAALLLATAGGLTPGRGAAGGRLRAVLWLGATAAFSGWMLLAGDGLFGWSDQATLVGAAAGAVGCGSVLWALHHHGLQQVGAWFSWLLLAAAVTDLLPDADLLPWAGIWAVGLAWGLLAWGEVIRPSRLGRVLGALAAVAGAATLAGDGWAALLGGGTVAALVVAAVVMRDLAVLIVAAIGALFVVPAVTTAYFPGSIAAALATMTVGAVLIGTGVTLSRRRSAPAPARLRRIPAGVALPAAAVVLVLSAAGVLLAAG